jgi:cellulose biosynthesis protein BcsQ
MKSMKKAFTQLQQMKEDDSNISDANASAGESHFQLADGGFQFTQVENKFEPQIAKLFKQEHVIKIKLDLWEIILIDSQSTMDLICNPALVKRNVKSSHGGTMIVTHKAKMAGYHVCL